MTALRCRPGDLAVIRPTWSVQAERGAIVQVIRRGVLDEIGLTRDGQETECTSVDAWLCESRATDGFPCFIRDAHLRPLRPDAEPVAEQRITDTPEHAEA